MKSSLLLLFVFSVTAADKSAVEEFTTANNLFARSVYKEISKTKDGNFLVSPFSAETILALAQSGSKGDSAKELRKALHLPSDKSKTEAAIKSLLPKLKSHGLYSLRTANKIYVQKKVSIKERFKHSASVYHADIEPIDFSQSVQAAKTINGWVEKQTNDKITNLISSGDLDEYTRAVLVNALYFQANWSNPFPLAQTSKRDFHKTAHKTVSVDTLNHYEEYFKHYECPHLRAQFLELPFKGHEASLVVVLPNDKDGLGRLENNLEQVFEPQHELTSTFLNVALPKFRIETRLDLKQILKNLGVQKVFNETEADLSGIAGHKGDLFIKEVVHKTFLDLSEEGVEAAAATFVLIAVPTSARLDRPINFIADHPFIFYLKVNDLILFAGRVVDPSKS